MSLTLTAKAPLPGPSRPEIVAGASSWHLAVVHHEPDNRRVPKHYRLDRRACLDLLLAVKRAWWRVDFGRRARTASPGMHVEGLYVSSPLVEVEHGFFGEHVRVLGVKLRKERSVRAFREALVASMRLGRQLSADLARNSRRLAWPAETGTARPPALPVRTPLRARCIIPQPESWRPIAAPRRAVPAGNVLMLASAGRAGPRLIPGPGMATENEVAAGGDGHPHAA